MDTETVNRNTDINPDPGDAISPVDYNLLRSETYLGLEPWELKGVGSKIMQDHMDVIRNHDEKNKDGKLVHTIILEHIVGLPLEELLIRVKQEYKYEAGES